MTDCHCESFSVSTFSPGIVSDAEFIFRRIFSPLHVDEKGTVMASAFSDVDSFGLSCDRNASEIAHQDLHDRAIAQIEEYNRANPDKPRRDYIGAIHAKCEAIRKLYYEEGFARAFGVYDTGLAENICHVDVFQSHHDSKAKKKLLRKKLRDCFSEKPLK